MERSAKNEGIYRDGQRVVKGQQKDSVKDSRLSGESRRTARGEREDSRGLRRESRRTAKGQQKDSAGPALSDRRRISGLEA